MIKNKYQLTNRELDIMNILWKNSKPLIALDIAHISEDIPMNTVQATLKKLLNKKFIKVADIVYSSNVLSRAYEPAISAADYEAQRIIHTIKTSSLHEFTASGFITSFLNQEPDREKALLEIEKLEKCLEEKRLELSRETE